MKNIFNRLGLCLFLFVCGINPCTAGTENDDKAVRILPIEEFIKQAVENDTVFEEILIDELPLEYLKDLNLPAEDLVLSVKSQYEFILNRGQGDPHVIISLDRLFRNTGTDISAEYKSTPSMASGENYSEISLLVSQPIAENAFGKAALLQEKIIDAEIELANFQIIEAYEDYLAAIIIIYYQWYSAYENLKIGESSHKQNLKLFENIKKRRRSHIALPVDVNKINIQVLTKKEDLIELQERYDSILNLVRQAIRYRGTETPEPADPFLYDNRDAAFDNDYERFVSTSRTYGILNLLKEKSSLEVQKDADALLPSTNLLFGYTIQGEDMGMEDPDNSVFAGVSVTWPFPGQKEIAEYETSRIMHRKALVSNENKYAQLYTDLRNLYIQIQREKKLISIAEQKIALAESILRAEAENYSYGKVTLNDYIDAINRVDENKFKKIIHSIQLKILMTEWLRMTDQLVLKKDLPDVRE